MVDEVWLKPSFEDFWDNIEDEIYPADPTLRDASLIQFAENLSTAITSIVEIYLPEETQLLQIEQIIMDYIAMALQSSEDRPLRYPYSSASIVTILNEVYSADDILNSQHPITFSNADLLKHDIYYETLFFYANIKRNGEILNGADRNAISSSRLIKGINGGEPDYIIGHFLLMYWLKICRR